MSKILYSSEHGDLRGKKTSKKKLLLMKKIFVYFFVDSQAAKAERLLKLQTFPTINLGVKI